MTLFRSAGSLRIDPNPGSTNQGALAPRGNKASGLPPSVSHYLFNDHFCFPPQLGGLFVEPLIHGIQDILCNLRHLCQALVIEKRLECKPRMRRPALLRDTDPASPQLGTGDRKKESKTLAESRWWV